MLEFIPCASFLILVWDSSLVQYVPGLAGTLEGLFAEQQRWGETERSPLKYRNALSSAESQQCTKKPRNIHIIGIHSLNPCASFTHTGILSCAFFIPVYFHPRASYTDKKENQILYKEILSGAVAKSYMRKGFLIYEAVSHIWLCNCFILNFLLYEENWLSLLSEHLYILPLVVRGAHLSWLLLLLAL